MDKVESKAIKKLLVVDTMSKFQQVQTVRNYIDCYYKLYGTKNKGLIEIYFRTRKEKFM